MKCKICLTFLFALYSFCNVCGQSTFIKHYNYHDNILLNSIKGVNYVYYTEASGNTSFVANLTDNGDATYTKSFSLFNKSNTPYYYEGYWQNSVLVYTTYPYAPGTYGTMFTKTDTNLNYSIFKKYKRNIDKTYTVWPTELNDSTFIFAGMTCQDLNAFSPPWDIALMKTDKDGNPLWAKTYDRGYDDEFQGEIIINNDKSMLLYGYTQDSINAGFYLLKLDSIGNQLWAKEIKGSGGRSLFFINNSYYLIGNTNSFGANNIGLSLIKIDVAGNLTCSKLIYNNLGNPTSHVEYTGGGKFTLTSIANYSVAGGWDFMVMQLDTNGIVLNNKVYSLGSGESYGYEFVKTNDGGYIFNCTGNTGSPNYVPYPILFKTDSLFNNSCLPSYSLNFTTTDVTSQTHDTAITFNVTNIIVNVSADTIYPSTDVYSVNTDCFGYLGMEEEKVRNKIFSIYPNPANSILNIAYQLPDDATQAIVNTYDYTGKLIDSQSIYGNKGLSVLNVTSLPNGLYMYCIIVNSTTIASQRIVISK